MGCLLRCDLSVQVPFYYPSKDLSGAEANFISATYAIIAKLKDPQVVYVIDSSNNISSKAAQPVIIHGVELNGHMDDATNSGQKFMSCGNFFEERKAIPTSLSIEDADIFQVSIMINRSQKSLNAVAPIAEYCPAPEDAKLQLIPLKIEVLCYAARNVYLVHAISNLIIPGLVHQLTVLRKAVLPNLIDHQPEFHPYQFCPPGLLHPVTAIYELSHGKTELKQV